jgi:hypothetical protein
MTIRAGAAGGRFERIDQIISRYGVDDQTDQQQGKDPHQKHDLFLFDEPRISGVIKDCVKQGKGRVKVFSLIKCTTAEMNLLP